MPCSGSNSRRWAKKTSTSSPNASTTKRDRGLITAILGHAPTPPSHSTFALACASANEVDALVKRIGAAGHVVKKAPWDAFWGQRYAIVADPDGYMVDLFAPL